MSLVYPQNNRKHVSLIIKPTHNCNLACKYCYIHENAENGFMTQETLENVIAKPLEIFDHVSFIWHGGEPLSMPLGFYQNVVNKQKNYQHKKIGNCFQTNATLLTDEYLDFCETNKFSLGFSLDGYKEVNDKTRVFKNYKSCFERTIDSIRKAKKRKLGDGIIVVVNKLNIDEILQIYEFAKKEELNLKLNPLIQSGNAIKNYSDLSIKPKEYGEMLIKLFNRWYNEDTTIRIDPLEEIIGNIISGKTFGCNYSSSCQNNFLSIGPQGDIYPCGRFDGIADFKLGNINHDDLSKIINSNKRKRWQTRSESLDKCSKCEYKSICNGGCMHNAYLQRGDIFDRDFYCPSYKMIFNHLSQIIDQELILAEVET